MSSSNRQKYVNNSMKHLNLKKNNTNNVTGEITTNIDNNHIQINNEEVDIFDHVAELEQFHKQKTKASWAVTAVGCNCICAVICIILLAIMLPYAKLYPSLIKSECKITSVELPDEWYCSDSSYLVYRYTFKPSDGSSFGPNNQCMLVTELDEGCTDYPNFSVGENVDCLLWPNKCKGSVGVNTPYQAHYIICIGSGVLSFIFCASCLCIMCRYCKLVDRYGFYNRSIWKRKHYLAKRHVARKKTMKQLQQIRN
mmetsp:Transcript_35107/g.30977  ORF Transcript_35107/g.30977 Transcript_35107/m.30977 type:complete len:254 (-) Transcript_35107:124-885(-)